MNINSIFNAKHLYLIYQKLIDDGHLMIIEMETRTRMDKNGISYVISKDNKAILNIYISQKNCTISNFSNNFCQFCKENYGKFNNKCYHKNEKIRNFYFEESSQTFEQCELNKTNFKCSICPEGTYIKEIYDSYYICEHCTKGYYSNDENQMKCTLCPISHCVECSTKDICLKCRNRAVNGLKNCSTCENTYDWIFEGNFCKPFCPKYYYEENNNIYCIEDLKQCPREVKYLNLETGECRDDVSNEDLIRGKYLLDLNNTELDEKSNDIMMLLKDHIDLMNEILISRNIEIMGTESNIQIGLFFNTSNEYYRKIDFGNCPEILRLHLNISQPEELMFKIIDFKTIRYGNKIEYEFYRTSDIYNPLNTQDCENQTIKYILPSDDFLEYLKEYKYKDDVMKYLKDGHEIFDAYSKVYNDPCYPLSLLNKVDLTLQERRKEIYIFKDSIPFFNGCEYEGLNMETFDLLFYCPKIVNPQKFEEGFKDLKNISSNLIVLKCAEIIHEMEYQKNNYFSQLLMLFFIVNIILIIRSECQNKEFRNYLPINNNKNDINNTDNNINGNNNNNNNNNYNGNNNNGNNDFINKKYCEIFCIFIKENTDFIDTFLMSKNSKVLKKMKIILYIFSTIFSLVVNTLFLTDKQMHKIYIEEGQYNIPYKLPQVLLTNILNYIVIFFISKLIDCNCYTKRIIFYLICITFNLFGWYYFSCFFAIYENEQKHLFFDYLFGLLITFLILLKALLYGIIIIIFQKIANYCRYVKCLLEKYLAFFDLGFNLFLDILLEIAYSKVMDNTFIKDLLEY